MFQGQQNKLNYWPRTVKVGSQS